MEKQKEMNIGMEIGFLNNRIRMTIAGYQIKNEDLMGVVRKITHILKTP
ncbi:MAG: hypothetical protein LBN18_08595 [Dysgonamonadaceae bacterium]|jgi:hypothetical protein|nr:hypothetical protein [Dysgonamonadaceae bacterium]